MRVHMAIVFVSNMERSVAFYQDVLGMPLRFQSTHWTEFATDGATLALHLSESPAAGESPGAEQSGHCRPGFRVRDLDAFHARMLAHGVICSQEPTMTFGTRIAHYQDPDGLGIGVSEEHA